MRSKRNARSRSPSLHTPPYRQRCALPFGFPCHGGRSLCHAGCSLLALYVTSGSCFGRRPPRRPQAAPPRASRAAESTQSGREDTCHTAHRGPGQCPRDRGRVTSKVTDIDHDRKQGMTPQVGSKRLPQTSDGDTATPPADGSRGCRRDHALVEDETGPAGSGVRTGRAGAVPGGVGTRGAGMVAGDRAARRLAPTVQGPTAQRYTGIRVRAAEMTRLRCW